MKQSNTFSSRIGVIAATVGSAIGLGNIWRFPGEAQVNGGAAFLFIYIICVLVLGVPVMLAETSLGRAGRSDSVGNFRNLTPKSHWWLAGTVGLLASYIILSFYMVVSGWTIEYLFDSLSGDLFDGYAPTSLADERNFFSAKMTDYVASTWNPLIWTYVMIALNLGILLLGVRKGIEKMSNFLMPLMFVLLIIFCIVSLTLPGAGEGLSFFLKPDFSKIDINVILNALGQAFFSLSLGMGILVTYSAYYPKDTNLTQTAVTVSFCDFAMAFLMGLIIFPAVKSFGIGESVEEVEGTTLVFVTLPEIFAHMGAARLWSSLFFLLLAVAAITSTVSVAEVSVAFVRDRLRLSRTLSCIVVMLPIVLTSTLCSLSLGSVPGIRVGDMPLFDFLDIFSTNLLLPLSSLLICIYVGWVLPKSFIRDELTNFGTIPSLLAPAISFLIRYLAPALISLILIMKLFSEQ